jgi:hypothetical protein
VSFRTTFFPVADDTRLKALENDCKAAEDAGIRIDECGASEDDVSPFFFGAGRTGMMVHFRLSLSVVVSEVCTHGAMAA